MTRRNTDNIDAFRVLFAVFCAALCAYCAAGCTFYAGVANQ